MSKDNIDFFSRKRQWSRTKDSLLEAYLSPYLAKILHTRRPLLYVDCFAGKGVFGDGEPGSPLIACSSIQEALERTRSGNHAVNAFFVEKSYASELQENINGFGFARAIEGDYDSACEDLLKVDSHRNVFLYVDPFGIKYLDLGFFIRLAQRYDSAEILINLNSFGFFRAACSIYGVEYSDVDAFDELVEREPSSFEGSEGIEMLNRVAGGDYWKKMVEDYKSGRIDGYVAERQFSEAFCEKLRQGYAYVLNMPIRLKAGQRPKYRMVHACNHEDGCILMYDNMQRRQVEMQTIQRGGQTSMFFDDSDSVMVDELLIKSRLREHLLQITVPTKLEVALAQFVTREGLTLPLSELKSMVKEFDRDGSVRLIRTPAQTESGRPSIFMESKGEKVVMVVVGNA